MRETTLLTARDALFGALLSLLALHCSDKDAGAGAPLCTPHEPDPSAGCTPRLPDCWVPSWKPPRAPAPNACTEEQLVADYTKCWESGDPDCDDFKRDPANATCLQCLFSTLDEPTYGPLLLLANGSVMSNVPGCIASVDGDLSETGCGAKYQAYFACIDDACAHNCASYDEYVACTDQASVGVCRALLNAAACRQRPAYAICTSYSSWDQFFLATGRLFCVSGFDRSGGANDAAAGSDDRDAGASDPDAAD